MKLLPESILLGGASALGAGIYLQFGLSWALITIGLGGIVLAVVLAKSRG